VADPNDRAARPIERRLALRNSGLIDPRSFDDYLAASAGTSGIDRALELGSEGVIDELLHAGLEAPERGRGEVGSRWLRCREAAGDEKYVICNAVDADARTEAARLLLATDPFAVLEGLLIAALAVGASRGYVCGNARYRDERATLEEALRQMAGQGLLGDRILSSDFSCQVTVEEVAPALVAAEDTALIRVLEGREPLPFLGSEDPLVRGLFGLPTLIESAETLAKVSAIFQAVPAAVEAGAVGVAGTKIVTVSGDLAHPATVEVPLGTSIRAVLEATQGTTVAQLGLGVVQFGGPTGVFLAGEALDTPIDWEGLAKVGATMGSGSLHVYGAERCAVQSTREVTALLHEESCGQCPFCREGTRQLVGILDDVLEQGTDEEHMELLVELGEAMQNGCICELGRQASNPVLSSLRLFAADYEAHRAGEECPAVKA
jgi:NADH:ubiquinone oxidoreductase subunit F (NADH-binding)